MLPYFDNEGQVGGLLLMTEELTECKRIGERLQQVEEDFMALISGESRVYYRMRPELGRLKVLRGGGFLNDTDQDSVDWLHNYIPPNELAQVCEAIAIAISEQTTFALEHQVYRKDGAVGYVYSRAVPKLNDFGEIIEWLGLAEDITDRKVAEGNLRVALPVSRTGIWMWRFNDNYLE